MAIADGLVMEFDLCVDLLVRRVHVLADLVAHFLFLIVEAICIVVVQRPFWVCGTAREFKQA